MRVLPVQGVYQQQPAGNSSRGCLEACLACDKSPTCPSIPAVLAVYLRCKPCCAVSRNYLGSLPGASTSAALSYVGCRGLNKNVSHCMGMSSGMAVACSKR